MVLTSVDIFLSKVRRRISWTVFLNRLAVCTLIVGVATISALVMATLYFVPLSIIPIAVAIVAIAAFVIALLKPWPTRLSAAAFVDRQLQLDDLLTTVINVHPVPFDDLSTVVNAIADARCRNFSLSTLAFPQTSARLWTGASFTIAIAIASLVVPHHSRVDQSVRANASVLIAEVGTDKLEKSATAPQQLLLSGRVSQRDPISEGGTQMSTPVAQTTNADTVRPVTVGTSSSSNGARSAMSQSSQVINAASAAGTSHDDGGKIVSAGSEESHADRVGHDATAQNTGTTESTLIPAWRSHTEPIDRADAPAAMISGSVPANCRDLVRDYFSDSSAN